MKELLGGAGIENAFESLGVEAVRAYDGRPDKCRYEIWQVSDEDFARLNAVPDVSWREDWGWWRASDGSNMAGEPIHEFVVNGYPMKGWRDESNEDIELYMSSYPNLLTYLSVEIGASTERNVCALCVDLAKINEVTMAELFRKHQ